MRKEEIRTLVWWWNWYLDKYDLFLRAGSESGCQLIAGKLFEVELKLEN